MMSCQFVTHYTSTCELRDHESQPFTFIIVEKLNISSFATSMLQDDIYILPFFHVNIKTMYRSKIFKCIFLMKMVIFHTCICYHS